MSQDVDYTKAYNPCYTQGSMSKTVKITPFRVLHDYDASHM
ncbi:unnamed protein product [marine sediment metagenome]|uniref:Uncharacterized protein n=1 Tax=marine sediment metagenome TaxID=412755 RepID=X1HC70_9ZZZZ